jgi:glycosyltransferase involved in cell wall biosynthesis
MVFFIVLDVCLCTHNPRAEILTKVLASIQNQTVGGDEFNFLLVDNASSPPLDESLLAGLAQKGISARMVREPMLGIARARLRAILETDGDLLLFVDDDNELTPRYVAEGVRFAFMHQDVGCFGGKLLLPPDVHPACWVQPFLPYLAIKDIGEVPVFGKSASWGNWEPPTAGAFIRRSVLVLYQQKADKDETVFKLGRMGGGDLSSCEDAFIMSGAFSLGLANAYNPDLVLYHHIDVKRFNFNYLLRLMYAYGVSNVVLESLSRPDPGGDPSGESCLKLLRKLISAVAQSLPFGIGMAAYYLGARAERRRQHQQRK